MAVLHIALTHSRPKIVSRRTRRLGPRAGSEVISRGAGAKVLPKAGKGNVLPKADKGNVLESRAAALRLASALMRPKDAVEAGLRGGIDGPARWLAPRNNTPRPAGPPRALRSTTTGARAGGTPALPAFRPAGPPRALRLTTTGAATWQQKRSRHLESTACATTAGRRRSRSRRR